MDMAAMKAATTRYGTIRRWKLMPVESMATNSELAVRREVKKITVMNTNSGLNMFTKYGMKLR